MMSNSSLVQYTKLSPQCTKPRNAKIDKITIHHMAGNLSIETCGNVFQTREASSNYGIGSDGRIGMYVEEKNRAWTSSSRSNDNRAVTIEVANDKIGGDWHVSDKALASLIKLCVDICKRNGIKALNFTGNANGNLTMHKYFVATACPGPYLESKFPYIAKEVNKQLSAKTTTTSTTTSTSLKFGSKGSAVVTLQKNLIYLKYSCGSAGADGDFGTGTQAAVKKFQKANKLTANGVVDTETNKAITNAVAAAKKKAAAKKSNTTIAKEVIAGKWGNGSDRKKRLIAAGYDYNKIQRIVTKLL